MITKSWKKTKRQRKQKRGLHSSVRRVNKLTTKDWRALSEIIPKASKQQVLEFIYHHAQCDADFRAILREELEKLQAPVTVPTENSDDDEREARIQRIMAYLDTLPPEVFDIVDWYYNATKVEDPKTQTLVNYLCTLSNEDYFELRFELLGTPIPERFKKPKRETLPDTAVIETENVDGLTGKESEVSNAG